MRALDVALTQLDVREATGQNDGVPAVRYMRGDKLAWCGGFALYCNAQSQDPKVALTEAQYYLMRQVLAFENEMKRRGLWLPPVHTPEPNDFIFFGDRGASDTSTTGRHMGIVEKYVHPVVHTVEGNWGNRVQQVAHDLSRPDERARVTGYARLTSG